jgi:hypothetical protein
MRINSIGTPLVFPPEPSVEVGASRAVTPVQARTPGQQGEPRPMPVPAPLVAPAPARIDERRQQVRRGEDRRTRQVAVLIDTRVGQRRAQRRRAGDDPAASIDVKA